MNIPPAKMEKNRDARRKTSSTNSKRQQHSSANLILGFNGGVAELVCLDKARKEKIRRLSSVNSSIHNCKTEVVGGYCGCDLSSDNTENQCPSHSQRRKSKISRKFSDECNVVDHTSVPRKLRSAMKKRGDGVISPHSPDSKKPKDSHSKDGPKKPKLNLKQGGSITKDEEEVVETLYALAGMFPDGDSMEEVKSSTPPETTESPVPVLEVKKEDTNSVQAAESSNEADKLNSSNEPSTRELPDLLDSKKPHLELDSTVSKMRLNTAILDMAKSEPDSEKSSCIHGDFHVRSEPSLEARLKQPKQQVTNLFETKSEMAFGLAAFENQIAQQHMTREPRKHGLALWPGLSPSVPQSASSSQSAANTIPTWLDAANYGPRTCTLETAASTEKVSEITTDRNVMKRSTTHVYVSRLIHNLQMRDNKDGILQQPLWMKPRVGLKETALLFPNNCGNLRNDLNGNVPGSTSGNTATDGNHYEDRSGIITQQTMLHDEQPQAASASGINSSQGQRFDFLTLSAGGVRMEANSSSHEVRNAMTTMSQRQVPYLHSVPQHQSLVPFSAPPTRYLSSACTDNLSTERATQQQVHLHLPQYFSNPFCDPPYTSHSGITKQQQHQRLWAAHRAAQYRNHGTSTVLTQFSSQQNGKPDPSPLMPSAQTAIPTNSTLDDVRRKCLYFV